MQVVCSVATNEHHSKQCLFEKAGNYAIRNFYFAENDFIAGGEVRVVLIGGVMRIRLQWWLTPCGEKK